MSQSLALLGRGGTGKTTLAINIAAALAGFGFRTVLADADLAMPAVGTCLGCPPPDRTLNQALTGQSGPSDVLYQHPSGFAVALSDGIGQGGNNLAPTLGRLRDGCDVLLIDAPGGVGFESQQAARAADQAVVIASPDRLGISSARTVLDRLKPAAPAVVLNRWRDPTTSVHPRAAAEQLGAPVISAIPDDLAFSEAAWLRWPMVNTHPDSPAAIAVKKLAARLVGQEYDVGFATRNPFRLALRTLGVVA
jgi:MinD-like ATPase involved in chromosome partitioning or flagellar assembly